MSLLTDALKKPERRPDGPFAFCHVVHRFTYEGDENSTSAQIESVYRVCRRRGAPVPKSEKRYHGTLWGGSAHAFAMAETTQTNCLMVSLTATSPAAKTAAW